MYIGVLFVIVFPIIAALVMWFGLWMDKRDLRGRNALRSQK